MIGTVLAFVTLLGTASNTYQQAATESPKPSTPTTTVEIILDEADKERTSPDTVEYILEEARRERVKAVLILRERNKHAAQ